MNHTPAIDIRVLHEVWCREAGVRLPWGWDRECAWAEWLRYVIPAIRDSEHPQTTPEQLLVTVLRRRKRLAADKPAILRAWLRFQKVTGNPDQCVEDWAEEMAESRPRPRFSQAKAEVLRRPAARRPRPAGPKASFQLGRQIPGGLEEGGTMNCPKCGCEMDDMSSTCPGCLAERSLPPATTKMCTNCGTEKPHSEYHVRRASKDGLSTICKACNCAKSSAWSKANRTRVNARVRKLYWKNVTRSRAYARERRAGYWHRNLAANRAKNKVKMRARYARDPAYFKAYTDRARRNNMPAAVRRNTKWRKNHPDKWAEISARAFLSRDSIVRPDLWPQPLVDAVIANRKLKRLWLNRKT